MAIKEKNMFLDIPKESIEEKNIAEQIESNMHTYAHKVLEDRALPFVNDGLKPVHRRILYTMYKEKYINEHKTYKSARVVGSVMGKYHPHGDKSIYDALVNLAVNWKNNIPLLKGEGNYGNIDGDIAAAMRYTEVNMSPKLGKFFFEDIELSNYIPNYDNSTVEPKFLPVKLPFILFNGTHGIAYSIATNIPSFNPKEIINLMLDMINKEFYKKEYVNDNILDIIKGPDYPTKCDIIYQNDEEIKKTIFNDSFSITTKAKITLDKKKNEIIIENIPPELSSKDIYKKILELYKNYLDIKSSKKQNTGKINYLILKDVFNESKNDKAKIILTYNKNQNLEQELVKLLDLTKKYTVKNIGYKMIFLDTDNNPISISLKDYLIKFLYFRKNIIIKRLNKELDKLNKKLHLENIILKAIQNIDFIQDLLSNSIKSKRTEKQTKEFLLKEISSKLDITKEEAEIIINMSLIKLASLSIEKQNKIINNIIKDINKIEKILKSDKLIFDIIKNELLEGKEIFNIDRNSNIVYENNINKKLNKVKNNIENYIIITKDYKIYKYPKDINKKIQDNILYKFDLTDNDYIGIITKNGYFYNLKVEKIDFNEYYLNKYVNIPLEDIKYIYNSTDNDFINNNNILFIFKDNTIKLLSLKSLKNKGLKGIQISSKEILDLIIISNEDIENKNILLKTENFVLLFPLKEIPKQGITAKGVKGINNKETILEYKIIEEDNYKINKNIIPLQKRGYKGKPL